MYCKKGPKGLTYLSWASAWAIVKQSHSGAMFTAYENVDSESGLVLNYFHDSKTCWVKVGTKLTPDGLEYIMTLPVMDYHYNSIPIDKVTSQDVNTAIQRCLVKSFVADLKLSLLSLLLAEVTTPNNSTNIIKKLLISSYAILESFLVLYL